MKYLLLALASTAFLVAQTPQSFTGVITDTMCGAKHDMMKGAPDDQCVKMCAKNSSDYALYDGKEVWKLTDQKKAAKFPAQKVAITGTMNAPSKTIKVLSIEAAR